jgi:fido (protein-threonine AMPylation protein)
MRRCPEWQYKDHPQYATVMPGRATALIGTLSTDTNESAATAIDTRSAHKRLFSGLTPDGYEYYAGHYRGEEFPCLKGYAVCIPGDPRVGVHPHRVSLHMYRLSSAIRNVITALDREAPISTVVELQRLVTFISRSFVDFLTIHPYADGNGHAARTILCSIMLHYGFQPVWEIDPRPAEPEYTALISRYRGGDTLPLETYVLRWMM